jgi:hypothetical protein
MIEGGMNVRKRLVAAAMTGAVMFGGSLVAAPRAQAAPVAQAAPAKAAVAAAAPVQAAAPIRLDRRCMTGRVVCASKGKRKVYLVVNGRIQWALDARFGGPRTPTREGSFRVFRKSKNHVSSIYRTPMPYALFFSGGQAVHYSPDFARRGYRGASHGCVNTRSKPGMLGLFNRVRIGDRVVVTRV